MARSRQTQLVLDLLEGLPSIAFILVWRQTGDLQFAGWIGCGLALAELAVFAFMKTRMNPVLLGVNFHMLLATPLVVGMFRFGDPGLAAVLATYAYAAVLVTVTLTGAALTAFSRDGFSAEPGLPRRLQHRLSLTMLAVSAAGAGWALSVPGNSLLPVVATLTLLLVGRRFLLARWSDQTTSALVLTGAGAAAVAQPDLTS